MVIAAADAVDVVAVAGTVLLTCLLGWSVVSIRLCSMSRGRGTWVMVDLIEQVTVSSDASTAAPPLKWYDGAHWDCLGPLAAKMLCYSAGRTDFAVRRVAL